MVYFLDQFINGITIGTIYAMIAIGYTMVYGIIGVINFAHGEIYMIGAFIGLIAILALGALGLTGAAPIIVLALLLSVAFTAVYGWATERVAYRPLRGSFRLAPLISAIGVSIFFQNYVQVLQGARIRPLQPLVTGGIVLYTGPDGARVEISFMQIVILATTLLLLVGFTFLITRTAFGRAQRAVEQDRGMAALLGIDVDKVISATFVLGAALAAVAGVLVTVYYGAIDFFIGFLAGLKAFTAAVLGGVGSLPGAVLGGLLIGLVESFWSAYFPIEYKDVAVFAVLVLVLLFRPTGLLGRAEIEKV